MERPRRYDAVLNFRKFYKFVSRNKMRLKDSRYKEDEETEETLTLYVNFEFLPHPDSGNKPFGFGLGTGGETSKWELRFQTDGTKFEITLEPSYEYSTLLTKARIADGVVFAINHRDPNILLLFQKGSSDKDGRVKFWHKKVSNPNLGFLDTKGLLHLGIHLQILPDKIAENSSLHSLHPFHRQIRIQLYWVNKLLIDTKFSNMFETSNNIYESLKYSCSPVYWQRYMIDPGQELRVSKVSFWGCLSKHCDSQYGLLDIINNGMKTEASSFLIQDDETDYYLSGPLSGFIRFVSHLRYTPIQDYIGTLTLDGVSEFEKELASLGWSMFARTFLKLTLPRSFLKFQKELPAESNVPVITDTVPTETVPDHCSDAFHSAHLEIQKLYSEDLEPSLVLLGTKLCVTVERIGKQYGQTDDFSKMYANLFDTVQACALKVLRPAVDSGRIADHLSDMQKHSFRPNSKSKIKAQLELEAEAKRIGRLGEQLACGYYKDKFDNVKWMNRHHEYHNPYDLTGFDKERKFKVYIEVKSTIWSGKRWFHFSKAEYNWARQKGHKYIIAHVHIDETKKEEPKIISVTEFKDPTREGQEPHLSMWYPK